MMHLVDEQNRPLYRDALVEMHRQRKRLFIDQMKWALPCEGELEFDSFDTESAIYLLNFGADGALAASARLLPTGQAHLLDTVFPQLCGEGGPPRGESVWEATRFCPSPTITGAEQRHALLGEIIAGILEAGLLFGMTEVSFVAGAALRPLAANAGWSVRPLGPAQRYQRDRLTAFVAVIDAEGLRRVRARHGLKAPLLRYSPARQAA